MIDDKKDKENWDSYFIEGTNVLKNNLGIKNIEELKEEEKMIVRKTLASLYLKPVEGNFDLKHLEEIHKRIFVLIYPFAGKLRTCSLQKDNHIFCYPNEIEKRTKETLEEMNETFNNEIHSLNEFAHYLGEYYFELISIHPFREGNGRAIRTFIRDFVREKSKYYDFGPLDLDYTKLDKNNLMLGTACKYLYPSMLEMEFIKGLVKLEKTHKNTK